MRRLHPFRDVRARLLSIVLVALVVALAVTTYGFNLLFARAAGRNANSLLEARASTELGLVRLVGGRIHPIEAADDSLSDSQVWIFDRAGVVERPRHRTASDAAAVALNGGPRRFLTVTHTDVRLFAQPIVIRGLREGTLVTGISLAPYEQTRRTALVGSLGLAGVLLVIVGGVVFLLLRSALRPVARMTEQAAAWSEHDLDRRFELGEPHDELTQLGATLDRLLDRLAASLRRERRFSAELSHELRTPLAKVIAEAELALRRERRPAEYGAALELVLANARQVARIVEALVAAAQQEAGTHRGTADAYGVARSAVEGLSGLAEQCHVTVDAEPPSAPVRLGVDADLAERVVQPVVENACRYGRSRVRITVAKRGARVVYAVEDDGPGVADDERDAIFDPGVRGRAGREVAGAGLGLALARRLARTASGDVSVEPNGHGARFLVSLPRA